MVPVKILRLSKNCSWQLKERKWKITTRRITQIKDASRSQEIDPMLILINGLRITIMKIVKQLYRRITIREILVMLNIKI